MSKVVGYYIKNMQYIKEKPDFNDDVYNNCLLIEKCLTDLNKKGLLPELDKKVVNLYYQGYHTSDVAKALNISRITAESAFNRVTRRVAFILGSDFTDQAVLSSVIEI